MGKKKKAQDVQAEASGSFLAAEKQPIAGQAEVGIQEIQVKTLPQLIKIQKTEIVAAISNSLQGILNELVKEAGTYERAALILAILQNKTVKEVINWLIAYAEKPVPERKEFLKEFLKKVIT
jgi:hypothetical protein